MHRYNDYTRCSTDVIEEIPITYPPRYYQYINGPQHFLVRSKSDGHLAAVFDRTRVRDIIISDPEGWEMACLGTNLEIDKAEAAASGNNQFWLKYLPFLGYFEYLHVRSERGNQVWYQLRGEHEELLFECNAELCINMWSNVRVDQWFVDSRQ